MIPKAKRIEIPIPNRVSEVCQVVYGWIGEKSPWRDYKKIGSIYGLIARFLLSLTGEVVPTRALMCLPKVHFENSSSMLETMESKYLDSKSSGISTM